MYAKYLQVSNLSRDGKAWISNHAVCQMASYVLEDMPNVTLNAKYRYQKGEGINIIVSEPLTARLLADGLSIFIHVLVRNDENATQLCQEIQHEISEQLLSMTEMSACKVNVKIDGIFA